MASTPESEELCWDNCGRVSHLGDRTKNRLLWAFRSLEGKPKIKERLEKTYQTIAEACRTENLEMTEELIKDHIPAMVFNVAMAREWFSSSDHPHIRYYDLGIIGSEFVGTPGRPARVESYPQHELKEQFGCHPVPEDYPARFKQALSSPIATWLQATAESELEPVPQPEALQSGPRHRGADLQLSQRRLAMLNEVTSEIATLYDDVESGACDSVGELKSRHPGFRFWKLADKEEQEALLEGNRNPKYKGFARRLVYTRHFARSEEQVKYDRKKLREAGEELPS